MVAIALQASVEISDAATCELATGKNEFCCGGYDPVSLREGARVVGVMADSMGIVECGWDLYGVEVYVGYFARWCLGWDGGGEGMEREETGVVQPSRRGETHGR